MKPVYRLWMVVSTIVFLAVTIAFSGSLSTRVTGTLHIADIIAIGWGVNALMLYLYAAVRRDLHIFHSIRSEVSDEEKE